MTTETEGHEEKSEFRGTPREWLRLVKTIVSMANTRGGKVHLKQVLDIPLTELDSARVDGRVARCITPRIADLSVELDTSAGSATVNVPDSPNKPHLMAREGQYADDEGRFHLEFHPGQVWVRHAASNSPATSDDIDRMLQFRASALLRQLGAIVSSNPLSVVEQASSAGLTFNVTDELGSIAISNIYPYTTTELAQAIGASVPWISGQANLRWRESSRSADFDHDYMQAIWGKNRKYVVQWRYSELARHELEATLEGAE